MDTLKGIEGGISPLTDTKITMDNTYPVACPCGHNIFNIGLILRRVSTLVAPTPEPTFVQIQTFYCVKCGDAFDDTVDIETQPVLIDD